jgi:hypothetical protein
MGSIKTRVTHIHVGEWFPSNDVIATSMARLCVLREDLYIELRGMVHEPIPSLDECSSETREIYFFRNCVKTLLEIRSASETLNTDSGFVETLSQQNSPLDKSLNDLSKALTDVHALVKRLRNDVAGHLRHEIMHKALQQIAPCTKCLFQIGDTPRDTHFKFSLELIGAAMLCHVPFKEAEKEWSDTLSAILDIGFNAIRSIDRLFVAYANIRNLSI